MDDAMNAYAPYIVFWLICGVVASSIGSSKGQGGGGWFIIGLLLGPLGVLLAMGTSRTPEAEAKRQDQVDAARGIASASSFDQVRKLAELHRAGEITDEEFTEAKRRALGL